MFKNTNLIISILFILAGIGSLPLGISPIISSIFIVLGVFGSLYSIKSAESRNKEIDYFIEAHATLLAQSGIGNVYSQAFKKELIETGSFKRGLYILKKALDIDPNDMDALSYLSSSIVLMLSINQWVGKNSDSPDFNRKLKEAQKYANRGFKLYPNNHSFLDSLGIICDLIGDNKKAKKYFRKSGKIRHDPYWRLLLATSFHQSKNHEKALSELKIAKEENAQGWMYNFYYGRALNSVGSYSEAEHYLLLAFKERGYRPELIYEISNSFYYRGKFITSAIYTFKLSLVVLKYRLARGLNYFFQSICVFLIGIFCLFSKKIWKISRHIPLLKKIHMKIFSPDEPEFSIGYKLIEKGHFEAGEKLYRNCCDIIPNRAECHANLALCLALQGLKDEALSEIDKSIELNPSNELFKHTKLQYESGNMKRMLDQNGNVIRIL